MPEDGGQRAASGRRRAYVRSRCLLPAVCCLLLAGCAQPVAPSGGPQDTTPPALAPAQPAARAVNVRADRRALPFSQRGDGGAPRRSLPVAPGPAPPPQ